MSDKDEFRRWMRRWERRRWPWPWPHFHVWSFRRKARRALGDDERADELARAGLVWLATVGGVAERVAAPNGHLPMVRPVENLWSWTRSATSERLAEFLRSFGDEDLRRWIERQVGFPDHSQGFGDRSR